MTGSLCEYLGVALGVAESIVTRPAVMTHANILQVGAADGCVAACVLLCTGVYPGVVTAFYKKVCRRGQKQRLSSAVQ
jgi:hypothetical protein